MTLASVQNSDDSDVPPIVATPPLALRLPAALSMEFLLLKEAGSE